MSIIQNKKKQMKRKLNRMHVYFYLLNNDNRFSQMTVRVGLSLEILRSRFHAPEENKRQLGLTRVYSVE